MDYLFLIFTLVAGYAMGLGSRLVVKNTLKEYTDLKLGELNTITTNYTQKVQIECDKLVDDAKTQAIAIYKEALSESAKVVLYDEKSGELN